MKIKTLGIDWAKNVFHLYGTDKHGRGILKKRLSRNKLLGFLTNHPSCLIWYGSVWRRALLGTHDSPTGT
jgi:hypothetical protein